MGVAIRAPLSDLISIEDAYIWGSFFSAKSLYCMLGGPVTIGSEVKPRERLGALVINEI